MTWDKVIELVDTHGKLHWPGLLIEGADGLRHGDFWVQRVRWLDVTRSSEICMTAPHDEDEYVPFVGEALLRATVESGSQDAMADLMGLLFEASKVSKRTAA